MTDERPKYEPDYKDDDMDMYISPLAVILVLLIMAAFAAL